MIYPVFIRPRLLAAALAAGLAVSSSGAAAQSSSDLIFLQDRVERLEAMMQVHGVSSGAPGGDPSSAAGLSMRIGQVEEQMRHLNGQIEDLTHMVRVLEDRLRRLSEDTEYRFQQGGGSGDAEFGMQVPRIEEPSSWQDPPQASGASGAPQGLPEPGTGEAPRILGQVPGQPLDLSGALGGSGGFGQPAQEPGWGGSQGQSGQFGGGPQIAAVPTGNPRDDYDTAYGYILRGEFGAAEQSFRQFLSAHPGDELAGNAQYWLGESLFARARYREAADEFLAAYTEYPDSAKAPDSLYKLGMALKELGEREAACATLSEIGSRYPGAAQAVRERARSEMERSGC
jgi:tol-pal system protein YbgF